MKTDANAKHKLAYFNVNKRVRNLAKAGFLSEIKPDAFTVNIHGRKDYMLSAEGLGYTIQYITQPEDDEKISKYIEFMKKHGLSQVDLERTLFKEIRNTLDRLRSLIQTHNLISESQLGFTLRGQPELLSREELNESKNLLPEVKHATTKRHSTPPSRIRRKKD